MTTGTVDCLLCGVNRLQQVAQVGLHLPATFLMEKRVRMGIRPVEHVVQLVDVDPGLSFVGGKNGGRDGFDALLPLFELGFQAEQRCPVGDGVLRECYPRRGCRGPVRFPLGPPPCGLEASDSAYPGRATKRRRLVRVVVQSIARGWCRAHPRLQPGLWFLVLPQRLLE